MKDKTVSLIIGLITVILFSILGLYFIDHQTHTAPQPVEKTKVVHTACPKPTVKPTPTPTVTPIPTLPYVPANTDTSIPTDTPDLTSQ